MEPSRNKPTQPFYSSSPLAKLSPLGRGAGPCRAADWIPRPASASPAALTPSRRGGRLGDTRAGLCPLAPHARRGRKSCLAPLAPAAGGPRGATLGAEGRRATSTSPPGPVGHGFSAGLLPRCRCRTPPPSCPGCPSSARKRAAAAERPTAPAARPFPLPPPLSQPFLQPNFLPPTGSQCPAPPAI
ncbi:atherin-like [Acinonyx jubatus]|uniref:Atherin-like n=1 Tax=Acinonyx jubatus TaxID=32536 RepID=A0ABM3NB45_ACIJB|nr:atherin-like [Acinonyx jubatus]